MTDNSPSQEVAEALNVEQAVWNRYSAAARQQENSLCCPTDYEPRRLQVIPEEILQRDYGCGDPSQWLREGDIVLDLGSGGGKICYIAAQVVGPEGHVIGVDANDEMLALARKHRGTVAERLGFNNVTFHKGKIQDLRLDLEAFDAYLAEQPVTCSSDWLRLEQQAESLRQSSPMIPDDSVDVVVSNCVLNLVRPDDRLQLFREIFRVLKRGGRAVISDIVSDEDVPDRLRHDAQLWSGCIGGAFREDRFLDAFAEAGFYGMQILARQEDPWAVLEGIEFRSLTVEAFKGKEGPCWDRRQAVIYNGPWKAVIDDDGHKLLRGQRMAVCEKTFHIYTRRPYSQDITPVPPQEPVPFDQAAPFSCDQDTLRSPQETKNGHRGSTALPITEANCGEEGCC